MGAFNYQERRIGTIDSRPKVYSHLILGTFVHTTFNTKEKTLFIGIGATSVDGKIFHFTFSLLNLGSDSSQFTGRNFQAGYKYDKF